MTRYNNPLPHNQVPPSQGRGAGNGQQPLGQPSHGHAPQHPGSEHPGWPTPRAPAPGGFSDYAHDPKFGGQPDPYAALRPDGYGFAPGSQSAAPAADPYGLAGYTAPQPLGGQGYQTPSQQPAFDAYGAQGYGNPAPGYATPAQPQSSPFNSTYPSQPQPSAFTGRPDPQPAHGGADQWAGQGFALDPRDYGGQQGYADPAYGAQAGDWGYADPYRGQQAAPAQGQPFPGAQPQQQSFEQSYAEDDVPYDDEPRSSPWKKVAVLVSCTIFVGGVLTFAYSSIMGSGGGPTPLVRGAAGPAKVKPSEPGGKEFAHRDSKIMGRLGEGSEEEASDPSGVRKVPVVSVGRDGSIQSSNTVVAEDQTRAVVAVPGLTVIDGLGGQGGPNMPGQVPASGPSPNRPVTPTAAPPVKMVTAQADQPMVVAPPPAKKKAAEAPAALPTKAAEPKPEKIARADPAPASVSGPKPTGAGWVAVLASVPASGSSRIDALKQFADMQQQYGAILSNKTPDIQEANLGEKGTYHRLMVGPPASRDSANSVCTQLKAQGYSGCWVTAY